MIKGIGGGTLETVFFSAFVKAQMEQVAWCILWRMETSAEVQYDWIIECEEIDSGLSWSA